jgi:hypothetical protein
MIVNHRAARNAEGLGRGAERQPVARHPGIELRHGEGRARLLLAEAIEGVGIDADFTIGPLNPML